MIGTELNVAAIILGGVVGLLKKKPLSLATQSFLKNILGASALIMGAHLIWMSLSGGFLQNLKQLGILLLALIVGKLAGRLLRLQKTSNRVGQYARERMAAAQPDNPNRFADGFKVCAALFCVAPLGIVGPIHDGLSEYFYPLAVKAVMDGLAVMGFITLFGSGVMLSAIPVLLLQGGITLVFAQVIGPILQSHGLIGYLNASGGFLIICVALLIFEVRKVQVADYLPGLLFAPLFGWLIGLVWGT